MLNIDSNKDKNVVFKYPVERMEYTFKVGYIAEKIVTDILKEEGFEIESHNVFENGVDVKVNNADIGIEIWNWCYPHAYNSRIASVIENLKPYPLRALVTSFISDTVKDYVINTYVMSPILIVELGFQILPKEYKEFYKNRKDVVFYPSREAHIKVKSKMMPLITAIKRVRRDKILGKYFPSYDYGNMVILDATGCSKEEFNNFTRELKEHREKVDVITVSESYLESTNNEAISRKEAFNAYVYNTSKNVYNNSKSSKNANNNVNNSNISNSKVENDSEDNISECIGSINERKRIKGYVTFTLDEIKEYFRIKNEYISSNIEEPKLYHVLYSKILRYAIYNWINLCRFCSYYPCFYIEYHNGVKDGNFYLLRDAEQSKTYMNIIDKIHKCLRKRLYLFFFKNYEYFNTSIREDRTIIEIKNPQTTITDYIGGTI
jgi:hypothetical protein